MKYRSGYKYQLVEDASYESGISISALIERPFYSMTPVGLITAKAGYAFDGPSGPTFDTKTFMRGSLFHDVGYQMMREGLLPFDIYRPRFDVMLRLICIEDGMMRFRAWYVWKCVVGFARPAADPKHLKPVFEAP